MKDWERLSQSGRYDLNRLKAAMLQLVAAFMAIKAIVIYGMARAMGVAFQERPVLTLLLAQGGEFAFVVFQAAVGAQVFSGETASLLIGAVAVSMLLSPLLLVAQGIPATVLDHDAEMIAAARSFAYKVFYGDATRLDLLKVAGAAQAQVMVVARARDVTHWNALRDRGVRQIQRELFESSLRSGQAVLEALGQTSDDAHEQALIFRRHNLDLLEKMHPHHQDRARLIAVAKEGRAQLEAQMAEERAIQARGDDKA